jgi:hypothetical protein
MDLMGDRMAKLILQNTRQRWRFQQVFRCKKASRNSPGSRGEVLKRRLEILNRRIEPDVCHGSKQQSRQSRADRFDADYLRDAQAYMLISMPTGTSTIFGVFQVIWGPPTLFGAMLAPN